MTGRLHLSYPPLVGTGSPLSAREQTLVAGLRAQDRQAALEARADSPQNPYRRQRVQATWEEIQGQPTSIARTLEQEASTVREAARMLVRQGVRRLCFVGCGDSLWAAKAAQPLLERVLGRPVEIQQAHEYAHYRYWTTDAHTAVIAISSSGVTARTVEALLRARSMGARTVGISNTPRSPVLSEADAGLFVYAERKGWPTQASTAAMAVVYQLGLELAKAAGQDVQALQRDLLEIPRLSARVLAETNPATMEFGHALVDRQVYLFSGGGPAWATANLGAAKVRECTDAHAYAIHLEEYHHYLSQKPGDPLFLIAPTGPGVFRAVDMLQACSNWGGVCYALVDSGTADLDGRADRVLILPAISEDLTPFLHVLPLQLFAYHLAIARFERAGEPVAPPPAPVDVAPRDAHGG